MSKNHPKIYTKPPNSGYGCKGRDLALLEVWTRYWQKGRVKRRQNSLHVYSASFKSTVTRKFKLSIISSWTEDIKNSSSSTRLPNLDTKQRADFSSLVQVDRWGWDSAETLLPINQPHEGVGGGSRNGGAFYSNIFFYFFIVRKTCFCSSHPWNVICTITISYKISSEASLV